MAVIFTIVWIAVVAYAGVHVFNALHIGLSSCLPSDFPQYPRATLASVVISDSFGNCTIQYRTRDSAEDVQTFYKTNLDQGDWTVTRTDDQAGMITFERRSQPTTRGYVKVFSFPGAETQFQIQIQIRTR